MQKIQGLETQNSLIAGPGGRLSGRVHVSDPCECTPIKASGPLLSKFIGRNQMSIDVQSV